MGVSEGAFEAQLLALSPSLGRLAAALTGDRDEAQDLLQTAALRLWRARSTFLAADDPEAWAVRVVVNAHLTRRRRFWHRETPTAEMPETVATDAYLPETVADVETILRDLPPQQRATLVLRVVCDLGDEQVAATLGCSVATVRSNASRALARLRTTERTTT